MSDASPTSASPGIDVAAHLKRALGIYRLYGFDHALSKSAEQALLERIHHHTTDGSALTFVLGAKGLSFADKLVLEALEKDESITRTLFGDGVQSITYHRELDLSELTEHLHLWYSAMTGAIDSEHTFSTLIWERDFEHVITELRSGLAEHGVKGASESAQRKGPLEHMMETFTKEHLLPGGAAAEKLVDASALAVLDDVEAFRDLDRRELDRQAAGERPPLAELTKAERGALVSGVTSAARGVGQRVLLALWQSFPLATPPERREIVELTKRTIATLLIDQRAAELCRALLRIAEDRKNERLAEFLAALDDDAIIGKLVELLESKEAASDAIAVLGHLPPEHTSRLVTRLAAVPNDVRARLIPVLAAKAPAAEDLGFWIMEHGEHAAGSLLALAEQLSPEHLDLATRACLIHDSPAVRLRGLQAVKTEQLPDFRTLVENCAADADQPLRQAALQALIRGKDPAAADLLIAELEDPTSSPEVARTCVAGLAAVGGARAGEALRRVLTDRDDRDLRKAAALALTSIADAPSKALLEAEASRVFGDRAVKDACREALRRIQAREGGA